MTLRLQNLIADWQGISRGQTVSDLYRECTNIVGHDSQLLPRHLLMVPDLDATQLEQALRRYRLNAEFSVPPTGRFDSALVPFTRGNGSKNYFLLVIDEHQSKPDQVALYAHAVSHLLLNYQHQQLDRPLNLDPARGYTHIDRLAELRFIETAPSLPDREVLKEFPRLRGLVEKPEEKAHTFHLNTHDLRQRLRGRGWRIEAADMPYKYTQGRILPESQRRGKRLSIDALLRLSSSLPIATVYKQRPGEDFELAENHIQDAALRLAVPFAYLLDEQGQIHEYNWSPTWLESYYATSKPRHEVIEDIPTQSDLWQRFLSTTQLTDNTRALEVLRYPYEIAYTGRRPRYYQEAAINRALIAYLQAKRGLRQPRILLTLATGTGKTMVAFQILWRLKQTFAIRRALFLADRGYLLEQAHKKEFAAFGDSVARGRGEINTSREIIFGSYQWLTQDSPFDLVHYQNYEPDYFDIIIVDECHRGSAQENSEWRKVLDHFHIAVQVGLTATPLSTSEVKTKEYFGEPVYTYSLSRGINDGFLAPYSVRYMMLGQVNQPSITVEQARLIQEISDASQAAQALQEMGKKIEMETGRTMRQYTRAIAEHLAAYLEQSDPHAKTIVFCVDNAHAEEMRLELVRACSSWARPGDIVRIVDDDKAAGRQSLSNFSNTEERQPVIVTTSKLLSTGVDIPTCKNVVLARGVGSRVEFKQIIGRGTRIFDPEKTWFTILDYAGAIKHFFDPDFDGEPDSLVREEVPINQTDETTEAAPAAEPSTPRDDVATDADEKEHEIAGTSTLASDTNEREEQSEGEKAIDGSLDKKIKDADESYKEKDLEYGRSTSSEQDSIPEQEAGEENSPPVPVIEPAAPEPPARRKANRTQTAPEPPIEVIKVRDDGHQIGVRGEIFYELGPDGKTLREGTIHEFAAQALLAIVPTPEALKARWSNKDMREELLEHLKDSALVALDALAKILKIQESDDLDILLYAAFKQEPLSRRERVERLRAERQDFFARFEGSPLAQDVLRIALEKYVAGSEEDITNRAIIEVPPLNSSKPGEYAQAFKACQTNLQSALNELQTLLYSV